MDQRVNKTLKQIGVKDEHNVRLLTRDADGYQQEGKTKRCCCDGHVEDSHKVQEADGQCPVEGGGQQVDHKGSWKLKE